MSIEKNGSPDISQELDLLLQARRDEMREKYNRVLPAGELLFNRFEKAEYLGAGEGSSVYDASVIMGPVEIGKHVWIGPFTLIEGINGKVTIGDYTGIGTGVTIVCHDSTLNTLSGGVEPFKTGDVSIGSYSVIGTQCVIMCGVTVGSHCLVAAGSVVTRDVPDYTIVAGTPAKPIGAVLQGEDGKITLSYYSGRTV